MTNPHTLGARHEGAISRSEPAAPSVPVDDSLALADVHVGRSTKRFRRGGRWLKHRRTMTHTGGQAAPNHRLGCSPFQGRDAAARVTATRRVFASYPNLIMDELHYHGEITTITPHRRQSLSVDTLLRTYKDVPRPVTCLSAWNPDDYDPSAEIDLSAADARSLAGHLLNAAAVLESGGPIRGAGLTGVRQLPTVTLCGIRFIIDERLRQLRNADDPCHVVDLALPPRRGMAENAC